MPSETIHEFSQTQAFHQMQGCSPSSITPANLLVFSSYPSFHSSLGTDLEVVLQIIHQECHVVS